MNITYSVDLHDKSGDKFEDCILLYLDETVIIKIATVGEIASMAQQLHSIALEINRNK